MATNVNKSNLTFNAKYELSKNFKQQFFMEIVLHIDSIQVQGYSKCTQLIKNTFNCLSVRQ